MSQIKSYIKTLVTSFERNMAAAALATGDVQDAALQMLSGYTE